jgi:uncharacterized alpha-E superfamily protein
MLSRIAQELFWLGRNIARAEHTARMLDGVFQASLQARGDGAGGVGSIRLGWGSILAIMGAQADGRPVRRDEVLTRLTLAREEPASVISCVWRAREGARTVRDVVSAEMWEAVNTTHLALSAGDLEGRMQMGPYSVFQYVKERSALFWGLTSRTMLRDEARAFLVAGGRIESADMVLRMLRVAMPAAGEEPARTDGIRDGEALALLQAVGGFQAYRRAVPAPPNAGPVARFLLYERAYPDSVAASVDAVHGALVDADAAPRGSEPVLRLSRLAADLEFRGRAAAQDGDLAAACRLVQAELALVDADIAERYFAGAAAAGGWEPVVVA